MSWTYDPTKIEEQPLYQVRYYIGDTSEDDPLLEDEEILFELSKVNNDAMQAAIHCCERIAAKLTTQVSYRLGPYSIDLSKKAEAYLKMAEKLRQKLSSSGGPTWTGTRDPIFDVGMMRRRGGE